MNEKVKLKGVKELENGDLEVTTKNGTIVLTDPESDVLENAIKRNKGSEIYGILSSMIVSHNGEDKKLGELTLKKFKASSITKLKAAADIVLGGDDFLSEETDSEITVSTDNNV